MRRLLAACVLMGLAGCQFTVGAATGIGTGGHVGTSVTIDPESGETSTTVGGGVTIR